MYPNSLASEVTILTVVGEYLPVPGKLAPGRPVGTALGAGREGGALSNAEEVVEKGAAVGRRTAQAAAAGDRRARAAVARREGRRVADMVRLKGLSWYGWRWVGWEWLN